MSGLSGSGKSTIANELESKLFEMGHHTYIMDGDNTRLGLNKNLGFSDQDRIENLRRVAEVCKLMNDAGLVVICSFISPFESNRQLSKEIIGDGFVEVYIDASLETCEERDPKGLYKKARAGEIKEFETHKHILYSVKYNSNNTIVNFKTYYVNNDISSYYTPDMIPNFKKVLRFI